MNNFFPCLLIPIYNHWPTIGRTVERLSVHGLPIYIVDDGSDEATQAELARIAAANPLVVLFRLAQNEGKGGAVMRGLCEARAAGCTHALQIDADGQHDTDDVSRFLALGRENPLALVCGKPIYDASVPKGRLYGRYITHFWVGVETLSFPVSDALCGFRLYPLAASCALIERVSIPKRMDFDPEILVRLAWQGVPLIDVPTRVTYPEDGLSHFDMWRDNLRISRMHTRLFFGMLLRLPLLLWRKCCPSSTGHWAGLGERGSAWGLRSLFSCYRLLGARAARWLLYPVIGYFFLSGHAARRASQAWLRRVHAGKAPLPGWRASFRHMFAFGQAGLDKLAAWTGKTDDWQIQFSGQEEFERLQASGRGALLIGSHLGNLEMTRALAQSEGRAKVNAVVYTEHARRFNELMQEANADFGVNLLQVAKLGPETALLLKEKIEQGELVVIVGDRTPPDEGSKRVSRLPFFGETAPFAQGPFILASLLDCPVYLFFCLREEQAGKVVYRIFFEPFAERVELSRAERLVRLEAYMQQYAKRLEHYARMAPEQWFNFYDFWRDNDG